MNFPSLLKSSSQTRNRDIFRNPRVLLPLVFCADAGDQVNHVHGHLHLFLFRCQSSPVHRSSPSCWTGGKELKQMEKTKRQIIEFDAQLSRSSRFNRHLCCPDALNAHQSCWPTIVYTYWLFRMEYTAGLGLRCIVHRTPTIPSQFHIG